MVETWYSEPTSLTMSLHVYPYPYVLCILHTVMCVLILEEYHKELIPASLSIYLHL